MMRKVSLGEYILYYLVRILSFLFRLIPVRIALFIARRIGEIFMLYNAKRRRIAYANLKAAFGHRYSPKELKGILRRTYANVGQGAMEVLLLPKMDRGYLSRYIRFENFHFAEENLKKGRGLIFLTGHFGNWEMANIALPLKGFVYKAIAREQKPYLLNELLNSYRESKGCKMISKGPSIKEALRSLRSNGIVCMLVDQDAGKAGIFVNLFHRETSWHRGVMEFSIKTGATIVPGFAIRERGPYIRFRLFKPIELPQHGTKEEIIKEGFRQYVSVLEKLITEYPDQWLWQHRRWKSTPVRNVIILHDSRIGHLRQSQAVAYKIRDIWQTKGYKKEDVRIIIIDVGFRKNFCKRLLILGCPYFYNPYFSYCQGCMACLRISLKEESYKALTESYADIVVSCGSSTAAINVLLSRENNAKSIVIMRPGLLSLRRFSLAIIPEHDAPPKLKNVIVTDGALNLINKESMRQMARRLRDRIRGPLRNRVVAILLGGDTKDFSMDKSLISSLLDNIVRACNECDSDILLTTSRRTPREVEDIIRKRLKNEPRCKLLIIANENKIEGAVEGILGLSDIAIISPESISMVSEAASSGSFTLVFKQKGLHNRRHESFLGRLHQNNFIKLVESEEVYAVISDVFHNRPKQRRLDDVGKIEEALERLL